MLSITLTLYFLPSVPSKSQLTLDIKSLHTVIPHNEGILALKYFLDLRSDPQSDIVRRLCLAELVLSIKCFLFTWYFYQHL